MLYSSTGMKVGMLVSDWMVHTYCTVEASFSVYCADEMTNLATAGVGGVSVHYQYNLSRRRDLTKANKSVSAIRRNEIVDHCQQII